MSSLPPGIYKPTFVLPPQDFVPIQWERSITLAVSPTLSSETTFHINDALEGLLWLEKVGPSIGNLARLRFHIPSVYVVGPYAEIEGESANGPTWCELFELLACEATGLQDVFICWGAHLHTRWLGGGRDVNLVRAVARIQGLQKLKIDGYFAKEWPAYLEEKVGMKVWEEEGKEEEYLAQPREFQAGCPDMTP